MKVICPECGTTYRLGDNHLQKPVVKARCSRCRALLQVQRDGGEVQVVQKPPPEPEGLAPEATSVPEVEGIAASRQDAPDYLAVGIFVAVMLIFLGTSVYLLTSAPKGQRFDPVSKVIRLLQSREERSSAPAAAKLLSKAHRLYRKGKYEEAVELYSKCIAAEPRNFKPYFWRGRALIKLKRYDEAFGDFEKVIQLNPRYASAYDNLGWLCGRRGDVERAIELLSKSLQLRPDNGWAYYNRGRYHFQRGETDKALEDAKRACEHGYKPGCEVYEKYRGQAG